MSSHGLMSESWELCGFCSPFFNCTFLLSYPPMALPNDGIMINMIASMIQVNLSPQKTYLLIALPIHGTRGHLSSYLSLRIQSPNTTETKALSALPTSCIKNQRIMCHVTGLPILNLAQNLEVAQIYIKRSVASRLRLELRDSTLQWMMPLISDISVHLPLELLCMMGAIDSILFFEHREQQ